MRQAASGRHGRPQQRQRCCTPAAWSTGSPSAVPPLHAPCRCLSWAWPWTLSSCGWVRCAAPRYAALCRCGRLWGHVLGRWAGCACGAVNTGPLLPSPAFPPPPKPHAATRFTFIFFVLAVTRPPLYLAIPAQLLAVARTSRCGYCASPVLRHPTMQRRAGGAARERACASGCASWARSQRMKRAFAGLHQIDRQSLGLPPCSCPACRLCLLLGGGHGAPLCQPDGSHQ